MATMYQYPDSFGDFGPYLSEDEFDDMENWPAMRDWYDNEVANDKFSGSYEDYIEVQRGLCKRVEIKTAKEMADEIRASSSEYVTYGESDLGTPIKRENAIADIESMDDEQIGDGTWYECDENGEVK